LDCLADIFPHEPPAQLPSRAIKRLIFSTLHGVGAYTVVFSLPWLKVSLDILDVTLPSRHWSVLLARGWCHGHPRDSAAEPIHTECPTPRFGLKHRSTAFLFHAPTVKSPDLTIEFLSSCVVGLCRALGNVPPKHGFFSVTP
jgi:hypothetical protein